MAEAKGRSIAGRLELVGRRPKETASAPGLVVTLTGLDAEDTAAFAAEITED